MLFDLRGKRKRFIQVIYALLAVLMGGGLIFFGIGSSANGGLFNAIGLGGDGNTGAGTNYDESAQKIERQLTTDPKDAALLLKLTRMRILAGNSKSPSDSTGQVAYSDDSLREFQQAADAWERYVKAVRGKPDPGVAILAAQTYFALAVSERNLLTAVNNVKGAAEAQQIYTDAKPSLGSYSQLAEYLYLSGDFSAGDAAAKDAVAAADETNREVTKSRLKQIRKQAEELAKQVEKVEKAKGSKQQLENPLGGLSGGGGGISGAP
jgi:hypothetical protein